MNGNKEFTLKKISGHLKICRTCWICSRLNDAAKIIAEKIDKGVFNKSETENNTEIMMKQVAAAEEKVEFFDQQQIFLPSPEEIRTRRFDEMMLHRRIERRLQERAQKQWQQLPEEERTIKIGLFGLRRIENSEKKIRFITNYVDQHYENELKHELDIN